MSSNGDRLLKDSYYISSPYGWRNNPVTGLKQFHNGVDYATGGKKVPFYSPADGTVKRVAVDRYGGNFMYMFYPSLDRYFLFYHMDSVAEKAGQLVSKGQKLGIVGTTGQSTGIHLHTSIIKNNSKAMEYYNATYEDPELYKYPAEKDEVDMTKDEVTALIQSEIKAALAPVQTGDNPSSWAKDATEWAKSVGLFSGDGQGNYAWGSPITREQAAIVFYNWSKKES